MGIKNRSIPAFYSGSRGLIEAIVRYWALLCWVGVAHGFVANPDICAKCHVEQVGFWRETAHSSAYLVLFSKNSHFEPDCIVCHSLGFSVGAAGFGQITHPIQLKGPLATCAQRKAWVECFLEGSFGAGGVGAIDSRKSPERYRQVVKRYHELRSSMGDQVLKDYMNVQCEHCHGNRDRHIQAGAREGKPVREETCRVCHTPERDPSFDRSKIKKVSCPKMKTR